MAKVGNGGEPNYMSRSEVLSKLAMLSHIKDADDLEAITAMIHEEDENEEAIGNGEGEEDSNSQTTSSNASTVKNVVLKSRTAIPSTQRIKEAKLEQLQREQQRAQQLLKSPRKTRASLPQFQDQDPESHKEAEDNSGSLYSDGSGSCSCESCMSMSYTSCSCCGGDLGSDYQTEDGEADEEEANLSSLVTNASADTIVENKHGNHHNQAGRDKGKHQEVYVVNGNDAPGVEAEADPAGGGTSNNEQSYYYVKKKNAMKAKDGSSNGNSNSSIPKNGSKVKQRQLLVERDNSTPSTPTNLDEPPRRPPPKKGQIKATTANEGGRDSRGSWTNNEFEKIYEPVNAIEIRRQKNAKALKKYLQEFAADWDDRVNDLNTFRRGKVLKELKRHLRQTIDLNTVKPDELGRQVETALRQALDSGFETINSNVNIGQMYVPMEENPSNSKAVSRENTDYDTFGSIDSLIFEPKVPSQEDIKEVHEEIDSQFDYLKQFDSNENRKSGKKRFDMTSAAEDLNDITSPGKTTFAERVRLFQQLGNKKSSLNNKKRPPVQPPPSKKITFLDVKGQETSWKEVAKAKEQMQMQIRNKEQEVSVDLTSEDDGASTFCPECHNQMMPSMEASLLCSTCNCCSTCDGLDDEQEAEEEEEPRGLENGEAAKSSINHVSSGTTSWDFVEAAENKGKPSPANVADETNLRRRLKEGFGASQNNEEANNDLFLDGGKGQPVYEPLVYSSSDMEHNVGYDMVDFLSEYAQRTSLFPSSSSIEVKAEVHPQVMDKSGKTVNLTEDMFRGDLEGTLRKVAFLERSAGNLSNGQERSKKGGSPELNASDSGIASPPPGGDVSSILTNGITQGTAIHVHTVETIPDEQAGGADADSKSNDSGMDEDQTNSKKLVPKSAKRDTMIRELKSKLKLKYKVSDEEETALEERDEAAISNAKDIKKTNIGTVESRKLVMGPQLTKLFAARAERLQQSGIEAAKSESSKSSGSRGHKSSSASSTSQKSKRSSSSPTPASRSRLSQIREVASPASKIGSYEEIEECCSDCGEAFTANGSGSDPPSPPPAAPRPPSTVTTREMLYGPGGVFGPKGPFSTPSVRYPNGMELPPKKKGTGGGAPGSRAPSALRKTPNPYSELGSASGVADGDRSCKSHYVLNSVMSRPLSSMMTAGGESKPSSRMETYMSDWSELPKEDISKWREEKAKRMLAWIHNTQGPDEQIGPETHWWKVM